MMPNTFERIRYGTGTSTIRNGHPYTRTRYRQCDPEGVNAGPNFGRRLDGHDANWLTMKHIIFPCEDLDAVHWRLIVIHVEERTVSFYDPFAGKDTAGDCAAVLQWLQHSIAQYPDRAVARHPRATDFTAYPGHRRGHRRDHREWCGQKRSRCALTRQDDRGPHREVRLNHRDDRAHDLRAERKLRVFLPPAKQRQAKPCKRPGHSVRTLKTLAEKMAWDFSPAMPRGFASVPFAAMPAGSPPCWSSHISASSIPAVASSFARPSAVVDTPTSICSILRWGLACGETSEACARCTHATTDSMMPESKSLAASSSSAIAAADRKAGTTHHAHVEFETKNETVQRLGAESCRGRLELAVRDHCSCDRAAEAKWGEHEVASYRGHIAANAIPRSTLRHSQRNDVVQPPGLHFGLGSALATREQLTD